MYVAAGSAQVGREALVVLHVARAFQSLQVVHTFELRKQHRGRLAQQVHQNVQPSAVSHADDHLFDGRRAAALNEVIEQWDQRLASLEREALLTDILRVQVALEPFRRRDLPQDVPAFLRREPVAEAAGLELVLQPQPLVGIRHVREFRTDRPRIDELELREDVPQLHAPGYRIGTAAGEELGIEIRLGQPEVAQIEDTGPGALREAQWVHVRDQVAAIGPDLNEPRYGCLFCGVHTAFGSGR
jgi:hypothetical protein